MTNEPDGEDQAQDRSDDVLSIGDGEGDGGNRGWLRWGAVVLALVVGLGIYRLTTDPDPAPAAQPAGFEAQVSQVPVHGGRFGGGGQDSAVYSAGTVLHLGSRVVRLRGPDVSTRGRTTAVVLGRLHNHWMVRLSTTSCESDAITVTYGAVRASGRFTPWRPQFSRSQGGFPWLSPDHAKTLVPAGKHLEVRRASTGTVLAVLAGARPVER